MPQPPRTADEIRSSLDANRAEFALSVDRLRGEITRATDWRAQVERHRTQIVAGAALVGFVVGVRMLSRRRRRRAG